MKTSKLKAVSKYFLYTLLALVLYSCEPKLDEGTIVNKFYEEARRYQVMTYSPALKTSTMQTRYDDEDYVLIITGLKDGKTIVNRLEVSSKTYDKYEVGDWYKLKKY
tara:strand:- start:1410 stop:1730 length:321 start_codon:yes stop_codon:yes gene_type:complete